MKKRILIFSILIFITQSIFSLENSILKNEASPKDFIITTGEVLFTDLIVHDFNSFFIQKNPSLLGKDIFIYNMTNPWIWDTSSFVRNQFMHPYFGSIYFDCARSNNLNFLQSYLYALSGSFIWETCLEGKGSSMNDFITTPFTGAIYGEIFHRLNISLTSKNGVISFIISPADFINNYLFNKEKQYDNQLYLQEYSLGLGSNFILCNSILNIYPTGNLEFSIIYNCPFGHKSKELFDQFSIKVFSSFAPNQGILKVYTDGALLSWPIYLKNQNTDSSIAITMNYDVINSTNMLLSNESIGFSFNEQINYINSMLNYKIESDFIFLSLCNNYLYLDDNNPLSKNGIYNYKYGFSFKGDINFNINKHNFFFYNNLNFLFPYTTPDSSFTFLLENQTGYEYEFMNNFYLGLTNYLDIKKDLNYINVNSNLLVDYINIYCKYKIQ